MQNNRRTHTLGALADPTSEIRDICIKELNIDIAYNWLKSMLAIRSAETLLASRRKNGLIGGPVHLGVGQEAIAVGVSTSLRRSDRVFGAHRSHSHLLALGSSVFSLFAEILGRNSGHSRGMGGSMHLWDVPHGFYGSVPIVAGTVSLAVGAGLAAKMKKTDDVSVAYLGDGAVEEGVVHESLNLARMLNVPILFVVENNLFASHMHIDERQPSNSTARFAEANSIPWKVVDGNDVAAVSTAAASLIEQSRLGKGPGFLEAVTYRWYGHVDWREDIDVGISRSASELKLWRTRDPISRLMSAMIQSGQWHMEELRQLESEILLSTEQAWREATDAPFPEPSALLDRVYFV